MAHGAQTFDHFYVALIQIHGKANLHKQKTFLLPHYLHPLYQRIQNWQRSMISGHEAQWKGSWESAKEQRQKWSQSMGL